MVGHGPAVIVCGVALNLHSASIVAHVPIREYVIGIPIEDFRRDLREIHARVISVVGFVSHLGATHFCYES